MSQPAMAVRSNSGTRRTHAPIRRKSYRATKCETGLWKSITRKDIDKILLAACRFDIAMKEPGQPNGPIGKIGIEVLQYFANVVDYATGRLEPSLTTIAKKIGRCRQSVVNAVQRLQAHGFLDYLRRFEPTHNDGAGPQVRQTSNAYKMMLPKRAAAFLGKYFKPAPAPDDAQQARNERDAAIASHRESLSTGDRLRETIEDPAQAEKLAGYVERRAENDARKAEDARQQQKPAQLHFEYTKPATANPRLARIQQKIRAATEGKLLNERESTTQTESRSKIYNPAD